MSDDPVRRLRSQGARLLSFDPRRMLFRRGRKAGRPNLDNSKMSSGPTVRCRFEKVCTAPMPAGALTRT
jgi:hypothetical protein